MPVKHVWAPTKGYATSVPPMLLPPEASPYMKGVYLLDGTVNSDFGHSDFPVVSNLKTNELYGSIMRIDQFYLLDGTSHLICLTTDHAYEYNTTTLTWDVITQGNLLSDCDGAWTYGTGISGIAYDNVFLRGQTSARHCVLEFAPVAHFPMNDDAADTDVEDTGGDNTGTASANTDTLSVAAVVGDGFDLEFATGNYVTIGAAMAAQYTDTVGSIAVWVNVESLTAERVICSGSDASGTAMLVLSVTTAGAVRAYMHDGTAMQWDVQTADDCIAVATDYNIVLVQDGVAAKIYLDTEDEGLVQNTATDLTTWFADVTDVDTALIGALSTGGAGAAIFFDGILDDWRYYEVAITAREVGGIYNDGEGTDQVSGFTTGVMGYDNDESTTDISSTTVNTHLSFWVWSDKAIAAEVMSLRLSEEVAGGTGATYADYFIPALVASTWQHVTVDITDPDADNGGTYPDDLNALNSIALVANSDPGPCVVCVDDVRTTKCFTGDEDNRFSVATMNDTFVMTNGIDQTQKYEGTVATGLEDLTTTLAAGSITTSEVVLSFKDHLILFNNTENAADAPQRASWTNIGATEDFVNGTAGYQDLVDDESWVIAVKQIGENEVIVYKERSIVMMSWVGGHTPFRFKTMVFDSGILGKDCVTNIGGNHIVIGIDSIYSYIGTNEVNEVDDLVSGTIYNLMNKTYQNRSFMIYLEEDDEVQTWIPTTTNYPDDVWCFTTAKKQWYRKTRTMTGFGFYSQQSSLTIGDLVGTIGEQNWRFGDMLTRANAPITLVGDANGKVYMLDRSTLNNDGVAITNEFQTPDFTIQTEKDFLDKYHRVQQLLFEASGQSVTTEWSDDGGQTWNPTSTPGNNTDALVSSFEIYQQDFDVVARKVRFRFRNILASSGFSLRYYGFAWKPRSSRR